MAILPSICVFADAANFLGLDPQFRVYLTSFENGAKGQSVWRSNTNSELSTASYTTTSTIYFKVYLVDSDDARMEWYSGALSSFSVTSTASVTSVTHGAALVTDILTFYSGSAKCGVTLTGVWAIGNTVEVSYPAISAGVISAVTNSQILTFTE